eukprot:m.203699 g.203699  ORF g.203699 m.203699 type:complete len:113 (+) comp26010_c1_seq7:1211-1549(+)
MEKKWVCLSPSFFLLPHDILWTFVLVLFLFLSPSNRGTDNVCIEALGTNCPDLEQLDFLGCTDISPESISALLEKCKKLKFLDISFCRFIKETHVEEWRVAFPDLSIKKSFS